MSSSARLIRIKPKRILISRNRNLTTQPIYSCITYGKKSAVAPVTLLVAATLATGIGYLATKYNASPTHDTLRGDTVNTQAASGEDEAMATQTPPGRPGTLTPDQDAKLKEMWAATLDIFGIDTVSKAETNGIASPSSENNADAKKKRRGLSLFGKKKHKGDSDTSSIAESGDNDKHGQTKEFQQALASQTPEQLREAFWSMVKHDHPDALLLRFLRARKWDVQAALVMLISTMHWRSHDMHVDDDVMFNGEGKALEDSKSSTAAVAREGSDFMAQLRMGKSFLHGTDKDGRPCCYVRVKLHHGGEQTEASLERFTVYLIETGRLAMQPPVDTATIVFDMTDFSMANMDYTPVKFMIKCFEANYPESLGSVLVYKAPWIFNQIWKIIKGWLDPVVAAKVHFASNVEDLAEWIPKSQIMKELGGNEDYSYRYIEPKEGENAQMQDTGSKQKILDERTELVKSYESEIIGWIGGEEKGEGRTRLAQRLRENYWKLDPFVRARSLYDRQGVIQKGGRLNFYPKPPLNGNGAATGTADADLD